MTGAAAEGEEEIIQRYLAPLAASWPGALGLADDCATIAVPDGHELVVTTDALVRGVHFLPAESAGAIAWKALAVNVSDLVGKGARPLAYVMALALPAAPEPGWMRAFADGLARAQEAFAIVLAGGDTDRTPDHLSVSITAFGTLPKGRLVRRGTARPGDRIYLSGSIGDATLGLRLALDARLADAWGLEGAGASRLLERFRRPEPRLALGGVVLGHAAASMDVSDGLMKDLGRMCRASGCRAVIEADRVPLSPAARTVVAAGGAGLQDLVTGGEDYEVLCCVRGGQAAAFEAAARAAGVACTCIGEMEAGIGAVLVDAAGAALAIGRAGWDHF